jgi:ribosome biogenesis GTPase
MRNQYANRQRSKENARGYERGEPQADETQGQERYSGRDAADRQAKIVRTALLRAEQAAQSTGPQTLLAGQVTQVYSLYCEVVCEDQTYLAVVRKTLNKISDTAVVVGDRVRFNVVGDAPSGENPRQAVIEEILPRQTVLTRAESFKGLRQQPIVANAAQMLIVVSLLEPGVKWGLVDRMVVAARSGKLEPVVCLNKMDLADQAPAAATAEAQAALAHYATLGVASLQTSVSAKLGLEELRATLRGKVTVLCGHSGVGKSSLIMAIDPRIDLRIAAISGYTGKGRHTTTSARRYLLDMGGEMIDTPGVKAFGLWGVTRQNLIDFFPDVAAGGAPAWRQESYKRIAESLGNE